MSTIENVAGSVNPLRNQASAQKSATGSAEPSKERTKRVETGSEVSADEARADTVEIASQRNLEVQAAQDILEDEVAAAALLEDIQNQIRQEEQQQLEQLHDMNGERVAEILT